MALGAAHSVSIVVDSDQVEPMVHIDQMVPPSQSAVRSLLTQTQLENQSVAKQRYLFLSKMLESAGLVD